jgi:FkbM family methyltransferase
MDMKQTLKDAAASLGLGLIRSERLNQLEAVEAESGELLGLVARAHGLAGETKSQVGQDIFALLEKGFKRDGFFVEFGATDGIGHSNTYLLEKRFGWKGILAEPARVWHEALKRNRSASIEFDCVWKESGKTLKFNVVPDATLSTITEFNNRDFHAAKRKNGEVYDVQTVSLQDLLKRHNAPADIDYLSIDTEGSEFEILSNFDFDSYNISIITCEHNYTPDRRRIFELLQSKGYERKFSSLSKWDDWYVRV